MSVMIPIWEEEQVSRLGASARDDRRFALGLGLGRRMPMRDELVYAHAPDVDEYDEEEFNSPLPSPSSSDVEEGDHDEEDRQVPGSSGSSAAAEPLGSLASLEDSLPTKRGLSGFYSGKSKSFATLADVVTRPTDISASDLAKPENPFNKRRRVRIMARMRRRAPSFLLMRRGMSCGALAYADEEEDEDDEDVEEGGGHRRMFPPRQELRVLHEDDEADDESEVDDDDEDDRERGTGGRSPVGPLGFHRNESGRGFAASRSFSLSDLHQHHQQHAAAAEFA